MGIFFCARDAMLTRARAPRARSVDRGDILPAHGAHTRAGDRCAHGREGGARHDGKPDVDLPSGDPGGGGPRAFQEGLGEQSPAEARWTLDRRRSDRRTVVNERLEEVDESCHGEASLDIDGPAVVWGLDHLCPAPRSAARGKAQARGAREKGEGARACNSWVFCPLPECWSPDIWNHTFGECWLKTQDDARTRRSTLGARTHRRFGASTRRRPRTCRGRRGCC